MSAASDAKPTGGAPALPPNVSIWTPKHTSAAQNLREGTVFTRLSVSDRVQPAQISAALAAKPDVNDSFCLTHNNVILIFDADQDTHHEHFRLVCLALKDADIGLDVAGCIHDASELAQAGFQLDTLSSGSILLIDLMGGDEEGGEDDEEASLRALMGGHAGVSMS